MQCEDCGHHFQISPRGEVQVGACPDCGGKRLFRMQPNPVQSEGTLRNMVDMETGKDAGGNPDGEGILAPPSGRAILAEFMNVPIDMMQNQCRHCGGDVLEFPDGRRTCEHCGLPFEPEQEASGIPDELRGQIAGAPLTEGTIMQTEHTDPYDTGAHGRDEYTHGSVLAGLMEDFEEEDQPYRELERGIQDREDARARKLNERWREDTGDPFRSQPRPQYLPWQCPGCDHLNEPSHQHCAECGLSQSFTKPDYERTRDPKHLQEMSEHPDPWMDNEPGSLTIPEHWGKTSDALTEFYQHLPQVRKEAPPKPQGPVPLWEPPLAPQVSKCRNCKRPVDTQTGECPYCGQLNLIAAAIMPSEDQPEEIDVPGYQGPERRQIPRPVERRQKPRTMEEHLEDLWRQQAREREEAGGTGIIVTPYGAPGGIYGEPLTPPPAQFSPAQRSPTDPFTDDWSPHHNPETWRTPSPFAQPKQPSFIQRMFSREAAEGEHQGWTNWETWHTKAMLDNDRHLYEQQQKMTEEGWTPEQIRDWTVKHVIGPENKRKLEDAQEWNEIPEAERTDPHYEEVANKSPKHKEVMDSWFGGPDVSDTTPNLIDPELVNWDEIHHNIHAEHDENQQYEEEDQRLKGEGLTHAMPGHSDETNKMLDAWMKHHGVPDENTPHYENPIHVPIEHLEQGYGQYRYPEDYGEPHAAEIAQQGYWKEPIRDLGWHTLNRVQKGLETPYAETMRQALVGQGYPPEQIQHIMRPQWRQVPGEVPDGPIGGKPGLTWERIEEQPPKGPDPALDQPGKDVFPAEWQSHVLAAVVEGGHWEGEQYLRTDPSDYLRCPKCHEQIIGDKGSEAVFCPNCNKEWPIYRDEDQGTADVMDRLHQPWTWEHSPYVVDQPGPLGPVHEGRVVTAGVCPACGKSTSVYPNGTIACNSYLCGKVWGPDGKEVNQRAKPATEPPGPVKAFTPYMAADEMQGVVFGETPAMKMKNNMNWTPGMYGRGIIIGGEPHTWTTYDGEHNYPAGSDPLAHGEYVQSLGVGPQHVDWMSGIEIRPNGEVPDEFHRKDLTPFIAADPRLKEVEEKTPSGPTMANHSRTNNMEPYETLWSAEPEMQLEPREAGLFGDMLKVALPVGGAVAGEVADPLGGGIAGEEAGAAAAGALEGGGAAADATGGVGGLMGKVMGGGKGGAFGTGAQFAGGEQALKAGEGLVKGEAGIGQTEQPGPQMNTLSPTGGVLGAFVESDYETPSSVPDVGVKHDDPEDVDQKEFNDQDRSPENLLNPNLQDSGNSGEDEVRKQMDKPSQGQFAPDSPGLERMEMLMPLLEKYYHSDESGANDPMIKELHELLEAENPGYLNRGDPEAAERYMQSRQQPEHVHATVHEAIIPPMQQGSLQAQQQALDPTALNPSQQPVPSSSMPPGGAQQGGHCKNCGGVTQANGACPQCGATNQVGEPTQGVPGGPSVAPNPQTFAHTDLLASLVESANHQGPVTPEQIAAVQQYLIQQGRVNEVPNVPLDPGNPEYAKILAEIQQNPETVPTVTPEEQTQPPAPQPQAPGGMPVPGMAPGEAGGQPMQPMASFLPELDFTRMGADNIAPRCPKCGSATTGIVGDQDHHAKCHACHNIWKMENVFSDENYGQTAVAKVALRDERPYGGQGEQANPVGVPAADQSQQVNQGRDEDSSLTWKDSAGAKLVAGQTYQMINPSYSLPDLVRVERVKPDGIDVTLLGTFANDPSQHDPNSLTSSTPISKEDADLQQLSFEPVNQTADDQNNEPPPGSAAPGYAQVPPSGQTTDEQASSEPEMATHASVHDNDCPRCGHREFTSAMITPEATEHNCFRCGHDWVTEEAPMEYEAGVDLSYIMEDEDAEDFSQRSQEMARAGAQSRSLAEIAEKDDRLRATRAYLAREGVERQARIAGKHFTPREQRELIDEDGFARNSDMLDLEGTHYKVRDDYESKTNPERVRDADLFLGI